MTSLIEVSTRFLPYIFELPVWDKLDNVSGNSLPYCRPEDAVISVQKFHGLKVRRPHPHDDDGQWQQRCPNDGVPGLIKVCDLAVGQEEEDKVLLHKTRLQFILCLPREYVCVVFLRVPSQWGCRSGPRWMRWKPRDLRWGKSWWARRISAGAKPSGRPQRSLGCLKREGKRLSSNPHALSVYTGKGATGGKVSPDVANNTLL